MSFKLFPFIRPISISNENIDITEIMYINIFLYILFLNVIKYRLIDKFTNNSALLKKGNSNNAADIIDNICKISRIFSRYLFIDTF